ncbi:MAG: porin, partial [Pseudomonadales bacterium]
MPPPILQKQAIGTGFILYGIALLLTQMPAPVFAQSSGAEAGETANRDTAAQTVEWRGPTMRARGRIYGSFESIEPPGRAQGDPRLNDTYLRRADVTLRGSLLENLGYYFKSEFMDGELDIRDAYIDYDAGYVTILAGFLDPIDEVMIPAYREFMEGASMESFAPGNQLGFGLFSEGDYWTVYAAAFKNTIAGWRVEEAGATYSTRFTIAPPVPEGYLLHIGAYASLRTADDEEELFRYSARSLLRTGERFVDTGAVADKEMLLGMELAGNIGSASFESQCAVIRATVPSSEFHSYLNGCYISGIWTLTGESRNYGGDGFSLLDVDRPVFEGGPGAWQTGLRYDTIDLSDGAI